MVDPLPYAVRLYYTVLCKMPRLTVGRIFSLICVITIVFFSSIIISNLYSTRYPTPQNHRYSSLLEQRHIGKLVQESLPLLNQSSIDEVETFLFFIGYPRSGHSIVGTLIDAHPGAIVAHEFNLFSKLFQNGARKQLLRDKETLYNALYQNSIRHATLGWRSMSSRYYERKGYSLHFNSSSFQGRFDHLKVIGDKSGGVTTHCFYADPTLFVEMFNKIVHSVRVPIKVLHVVRNPYDMIATRLMYRKSEDKGKKINTTQNLINDKKIIVRATEALRAEVKAVNSFLNQFKQLEILEVHIEELIYNTKTTISAICTFLGLECSQSYLEMCDDKVFDEPSRSRTGIEWDKKSREIINKLIQHNSFLRTYTFNN